MSMYDPKKTKLLYDNFQSDPPRNKTLRYLVPLVREYGKEFTNKLASFNIKSFGCADFSITREFENKIYAVFFGDLDFERAEFLFKDDDFVSVRKIDENYSQLIINLPHDVIDLFLKGAYSKMFSEETIEKCFSKKKRNAKGVDEYTAVYEILTKKESGKIKFKNKIASDFSYSDVEELVLDEYDYPPVLSQEVYNYDAI